MPELPALPPYLPFLAGAILVAIIGRRGRWLTGLVTPLVAIASFAALLTWPGVLGGGGIEGAPPAAEWRTNVAGIELVPCRIDALSAVFAGLFCVAAFLAGLFSLHVRDRLQTAAALCYAGSAIGAVVAGDLITIFLWAEVMAVASTALIYARGTRRSAGAGFRYLLWHLGSGLLLLAGAMIRVAATGSAELTVLTLDDPGAWLLLAAFGVKAGFPLVHTWLTDAYPESTPTGTVWLSAFTTKVAVYALARQFPGTEELIWIGTTMACFPIFFAVIENDLRRVLAYSLVNQVGFMVCGIGLGSELALAGAVAHACNDVVFKGLLFMTMGAVLQQTGRIGGNELGGLWRTMPKTTVLCLVGAASISAFPLFSGFVSKSMVMTAALERGYGGVWLLLLFASAGVFHHAGIKIPYFAFFAHDSGLRPSDPPRHMVAAMAIAAALCVFVGCAPGVLYSVIPFDFDYEPYDTTHVLTQLQLLLWSALAFAWLQRARLYPPELPSTNLDADWLLRRGAPLALRRLSQPFAGLGERSGAASSRALGQLWRGLVRSHGPRGPLARSLPTGSMMLWMAVLLLGALLLYYW